MFFLLAALFTRAKQPGNAFSLKLTARLPYLDRRTEDLFLSNNSKLVLEKMTLLVKSNGSLQAGWSV
tara:strand:- start:197 stop:397 length:201 start_codon:yes stop_codon:yes gene_type:complete